MKLAKSFRTYLTENVKYIYIIIYLQGIKLDNKFESIFSASKFPESTVNNLSIYLKNNLNKNRKLSSSK